jgi:hypothetical protein
MPEGSQVTGRPRTGTSRDGYLVDEDKMRVVRRVFQMVADGASLHGVEQALEAEAEPPPSGGERWSRSTLRDFMRKDAYFPYSHSEEARLVSLQVAARLDPGRSYGVARSGRHDWKVLGRERRGDGQYRDRRKRGEKPREEW